MNSVPYPITGDSIGEILPKINSLIKSLYEDCVGGAQLGDVFSVPGDVLTLVTADNAPITKTNDELNISYDGVTITNGTNGLETIGSDESFYVVTTVQAGGAEALGIQFAKRLLTLNNGLVTSIGEEVWTDI